MPLRDDYGAIPTSRNHDTDPIDDVNRERANLLNNSKAKRAKLTRFRSHMTNNVSKAWADLALLACYIVTGLLDSSSVFIFGAFVSMQTGNTIYLGLGMVEPDESTRWIRSCVSIGCFCLGSFCFSNFHRYFSQRKRWVIVASFSIQLVMIVAAALMVTLGPTTSKTGPVTIWVGLPLALIAFQSSGQAVMSRALQYNAMTSVVLTSIYCDLFSDQNLFSGLTSNVERNRRAVSPLLLLLGAVLGGHWAHSNIGLAGALWTAVGLKALLIAAFMFWPSDPDDDE
ncbi:Hypothetical protein R9X50_00075800 [Acrodontium crateriforme]|uniref:DUF1275 domain protein n=1 Tax=Acrodontium crateriforme TaxID=150365 RepID=A0AAQ3R7A3_9PEZI|nr:Hypothetical protein R9X50_00075800 [Acrodontium crateriforme]